MANNNDSKPSLLKMSMDLGDHARASWDNYKKKQQRKGR
jgi:hypothetical protein